jgi:hypothetical protein
VLIGFTSGLEFLFDVDDLRAGDLWYLTPAENFPCLLFL